jgi:dTDP-4-dehydrorhamnose 3,5-epimerase
MGSRFLTTATSLAGVWLLERLAISDDRGIFERLFCADELRAWGHPGVIAQANRSMTRRCGAVRGMHFQYPPHGEWKLVTCLHGRVHDVIVDLRHGSPTLLSHFAITLSGDANRSILVPPGCAHGFQTLTPDCEMLYFHSHPFTPNADGGVLAEDQRLAIPWPLPFTERSARDAQHPPLPAGYSGLLP